MSTTEIRERLECLLADTSNLEKLNQLIEKRERVSKAEKFLLEKIFEGEK